MRTKDTHSQEQREEIHDLIKSHISKLRWTYNYDQDKFCMLDKTKSNSALPIGFNLKYDRIFIDETRDFNINDLKTVGLIYPFPSEERNNQHLDLGTCNGDSCP